MKFFEKRLMLPLIAFSALAIPGWAQNSATVSDAPEINYNVSKPWPLKVQENANKAAGTNATPQLSLPQLPGELRPWTSTDVHNKSTNFQIAIVTDRNGGRRPGIFRTAVKKLNLLQPEFVMCIGDLIVGYTDDADAVDDMWKDFEQAISNLEMPFFHVGGNHDLTNAMLIEKWHDRIGPTYYHFRYGDVLFLCLNTEDGKHSYISDEQVEYFQKALEENQDVRWTLVFMHKPLWSDYFRNLSESNEKDLQRMKDSNWYPIEQALKGRQHTVFAGHVHAYTQYIRNGHKYYSLATTGGGSSLRGAEVHGRFDHVVWLTMTDDGPILANLALDGIYPADLRVEAETSLLRDIQVQGVHADVTVTDPLPFDSATLHVNLTNPSTRPLSLNIVAPGGELEFEPETLDVKLGPNEKRQVTFELGGSDVDGAKDLSGLSLEWTATYQIEGRPDLVTTERAPLHFDVKTVAKPANKAVTIDGDLEEWKNQLSGNQQFLEIIGARNALRGHDDVSFRYAVRYDAEHVYFGFRVKDDDINAKKAEGRSMVDALRLYLLPEGSDEESDKILRVLANPAESGKGKIKGDDSIQAVCLTTDEGYNVEIAVPASMLSEAGSDWKNFRMNVQINDDDNVKGSRRSRQFWRPQWDSNANYAGSGTVIRGN